MTQYHTSSYLSIPYDNILKTLVFSKQHLKKIDSYHLYPLPTTLLYIGFPKNSRQSVSDVLVSITETFKFG